MAGAVLVFFGLFGRAFTLGPGFIVGMVFAGFGLAGIVLLLAGPLLQMTPIFTQLPGGCPCPNYTPFLQLGVLFLVIGIPQIIATLYQTKINTKKSEPAITQNQKS